MRVVSHDSKCRIASREFSTGGPTGRSDDFRTQTILCFPMLIVQFKLDPQFDFRIDFSRDSIFGDTSIPVHGMKEHVIGEVLGLDESISPLLLDEHDLSQSSPLNAEFLFDAIFLFGIIHGVALGGVFGVIQLAGRNCG